MIRTVLASLLALSAAVASAADWNQWRGPDRDGKAVGESIRVDWSDEPPELLWTATGFGKGWSSLAITSGVAFSMGDAVEEDGSGLRPGQYAVAVDLATRETVWKTPLSPQLVGTGRWDFRGSRGTPTVVDGLVYVIGSHGSLVCLRADDGAIEWSKEFAAEYGSGPQRWGYAESPLVDRDAVLCTPGSSSAMVVKLDRRTGEEIWRTPFPRRTGEKGKDEAGYASLVVSEAGGVKQYVTNGGRGVIGVRASDGKLLWGNNESANGVATIPTPLVEGDVVVASSSYKNGTVGVRLKPGRGATVMPEELYFLDGKSVFENHHGQMILHEGHVYGGHGQNKGFPMCFAFETGEVVWGGRTDKLRNPPGTKGSAAVTFADGHVIWRYENGEVVVTPATPDGYEIAGRFTPAVVDGDPSWAHPVVLDGKLYLRENDVVMCYDVAAR